MAKIDIMEYLTEEEQEQFIALKEAAATLSKKAPKERAPMTEEQKAARAEKMKIGKAMKIAKELPADVLARLLAL